MFFLSTPYDLPLVEIFGTDEIAGLIQNIYAFLYPAMPIVMIAVAISVAGVLISVVRRTFSFGNLTGKSEEYGYQDKNEKFD